MDQKLAVIKWDLTRSPEEFEQQARPANDTPQFQSVTTEFSQNKRKAFR
jgi:hypothetical protein